MISRWIRFFCSKPKKVLLIKVLFESSKHPDQVKNLSDLREDEDEVSASQQQEDLLIVGTVFKQQERKPSILKELSEPSEDGKLLVTDCYYRIQK